MRPLFLFSILATALLTACNSFDQNPIDYKSAQAGENLEVPPDLVQLSKDPRFQRIDSSGVVSARQSEKKVNARKKTATAPNQVGDVRMLRSGDTRWLLIQRRPAVIWPIVRDFWLDNGFILTLDDPEIGIMETDWAENRAKIPQDFIRNTLGKFLDPIYSSGERDRFRTRLERTSKGATEVFISHKGMVEEDTRDRTSTVWIPAPHNPELETELLRRLMVRLGLSNEQSQAVVNSSTTVPAAKSTTNNVTLGVQKGQPVVYLPQSPGRAWRSLGVALDRSGFTIKDRNLKKGIYYVHYVNAEDVHGSAFLGGLFGAEDPIKNVAQYQIHLQTHNKNNSVISIRSPSGSPIPKELAKRVLNVIASALN